MSEPQKEQAPKAAKAQKLVGVKGMNDFLPPDSARWEWLEAQVRGLMARYAYRNVRLPIVEPTALFVRGLGEVTDIVEKEMYSFEDRLNGEQLTLRAVAKYADCSNFGGPPDVFAHKRDVLREFTLTESMLNGQLLLLLIQRQARQLALGL